MTQCTFEKAARQVGYILEGLDWRLPREYDLEHSLGPSWNGYYYAWKTLVDRYGLRKALTMTGIPDEKLEEMDWYAFDVYRFWIALGHNPSIAELREEYGGEWYQEMVDKLGFMPNAIGLGGKVENFNVDTKMRDGLYTRELVIKTVRRFVECTQDTPYYSELNQIAPWQKFFCNYRECLRQCLDTTD